MSRHFIRLLHEGQPVVVVTGYDRPLRSLFLHVVKDDGAHGQEEEFVYDSLLEPDKDWTDINTVADKLDLLGIDAPISMIDQIFLDQCFNAGNRVVEHHADGPPTVLQTS